MDVLAKAGIDIDLYTGFVEGEYFIGTIVQLHAGRTWVVDMEFGETVRVASRNFYKESAARQENVVRTRTTTTNRVADDADLEEDDCEYESGGEEALERLEESAPTRRTTDGEWTPCSVTVDSRDARGQVVGCVLMRAILIIIAQYQLSNIILG